MRRKVLFTRRTDAVHLAGERTCHEGRGSESGSVNTEIARTCSSISSGIDMIEVEDMAGGGSKKWGVEFKYV